MTLLLTSGAVWNACAAESDDSDSYFPIWGDEARARGYSIPLPFGVNLYEYAPGYYGRQHHLFRTEAG